MSLSESTVKTMLACAPVIEAKGKEITSEMYRIMFKKYPDVRSLFNQSHLRPLGSSEEAAKERAQGKSPETISVQVQACMLNAFVR